MGATADTNYPLPQEERSLEPVQMPSAGHRAKAYEEGLSTSVRRLNGAIYTPNHLVGLILDLAGYTPSKPIEKARLLDPACGCGAFLAQAATRLAQRLTRLGVDLGSQKGASEYLATVEKNLFGVDKDRQACELAREVLRNQVRTTLRDETLPENFLQPNIHHRDYLEERCTGADCFATPFDFIVGNPPYVSTSRLSNEMKDFFRSRFEAAHGRIDLYSLFFERSTELLSNEGTLAFITPDKFLTSESGRRLRKLLKERVVIGMIARFSSHRVFEKAAIVPCITIASRTRRTKEPIAVLRLEETRSHPEVQVAERWDVERPSHPDAPWKLLRPEVHRVVESLEGRGLKLGDLARRISAGIATGRDNVFVVPDAMAQELEVELLHPALRGKDVGQLQTERPTEHVIVPYRTVGSETILVDLDAYPHVEAYLRQHQNDLVTRHCVRKWRKPWFDLHDPWTFDLTRTPKVVFPDIANSNRFAFDPGNRCPLHSVYYLVPQGADGEYLAAVLSSEPLEFFIRARAPIAKDGFSRYRKQFLRDAPVPLMAKPDQQGVIEAARNGSMEEVNDRISHWFGLTKAHQKVVTEFVARARRGGRGC